MKPRLRAWQRHVPMLQLMSCVNEKVVSGLLMPSLMLEDAGRALVHDAAKRCAQSLEAHPRGDVDDVAASHFLSLCQSFRALLALASDDLVRTGLMTWWPCRICRWQASGPPSCM